eukprot:scaffold76_cov363-Pavlova_lutheri.AAC.7
MPNPQFATAKASLQCEREGGRFTVGHLLSHLRACFHAWVDTNPLHPHNLHAILLGLFLVELMDGFIRSQTTCRKCTRNDRR